jgi:hypothetical protein
VSRIELRFIATENFVLGKLRVGDDDDDDNSGDGEL